MENLGETLFLPDLEDYDCCEKERNEHEGDCIQKLDEDVEAWTRSILPRIANSVPNNSGGVRFRVFASEVSHFHIFLGVVHCCATPHHHDRQGYCRNRSPND